MEIVTRIPRMREISREIRLGAPEGGPAGVPPRRLGLVPTMGALHEGHLSLVRHARERTGVVVLSVFVNSTQFAAGEDFERYPRDLARDAGLAAGEGVDFVFAPAPGDVYPPGFRTFVEVEGVSSLLEGASRPGHFRGVATVVLKLFEVVSPDWAVFGAKDWQQTVVVRRMVKDLNLPVELFVAPTVREPDGLAMSSRNAYLSPDERRAALVLRRSLDEAQRLHAAGGRDAARIEAAVRKVIDAEPLAATDYAVVVDPETLEPPGRLGGPALVALAVRIGKTRLIDNELLGERSSR